METERPATTAPRVRQIGIIQPQEPGAFISDQAMTVECADTFTPEHALGRTQFQFAVGPAPPLVERQISLVIQCNKVDKSVAVPVGGQWSRAPLSNELIRLRSPPVPRRFLG